MKGSLLLTIDNLEIAQLDADERDKAVSDFFQMKIESEKHDERFYALQNVFCHIFSYGNIYTGFMYRSWSEFHGDEILKDIRQSTYQLIQTFCKCPKLFSLSSEEEFKQKENPHANTGFKDNHNNAYFVGNLTQWEEWHRNWYVEHQDEIDWSTAINDLFPRPDLIIKHLREELWKKFTEDYVTEEAQLLMSEIPDTDVVHKFHEQVMKHKGHELEGYASDIGNNLCLCNYYVFEEELSRLEQKHIKSLRRIYSIINRYGRRQFISIDFKHGMFELLNENGEHQGEYRFDGTFNSGKDVNHSFKCIGQWHKQTK